MISIYYKKRKDLIKLKKNLFIFKFKKYYNH